MILTCVQRRWNRHCFYIPIAGKGGNIYFGLSPLGKVVGIKLTRDERDEFRLGVDRMMLDRLSPCLLHSSFDVVYTPVVRKRTVEEDIIRDSEEIPDCFVTSKS